MFGSEDIELLAAGLKDTTKNLIVGISGAQGAGKSTLAAQMAERLREADSTLSVVIVSLDDFYLSKKEREILANNVHPLLRTRGVPGTHDMHRLKKVLRDLIDGNPATWPRFSKVDDDRLVEENYSASYKAKFQRVIVLLEGWCIGCLPSQSGDLFDPINTLEAQEDPACVWRQFVDSQIKQEYVPVWQMIDRLIYIHTPDWESTVRWRVQQGVENGEGKSSDFFRRFVSHFERISKDMANDRRMRAWAEIFLNIDHSVRYITFARALDSS